MRRMYNSERWNGKRGPSVRVLLILAMFGAPALAIAQWIHYPTAGVPRKADGAPDLTAPAPRLPDGKPDFSGIWHTAVINRCIPETGLFCGSEIGGSPLALDIGRDFAGGLPYQPWAAALVKTRFAKDDPHVRCLPDNPADPTPSWNGYSTASWEGDTLVVRTNGFRDDLWIDMAGALMTSAATMTERIRRPSYGTLEVEITIDDPKAYTRPWTVKLKQERMLDTELIDEVCLENEKSWSHMQTPDTAK